MQNLSQKSHILRELLQHHNPFGEEIEVKIGYARVSTAAQNLDSQLELLQQAGCQRIFQEHASGMNRQRAGPAYAGELAPWGYGHGLETRPFGTVDT